MLDTKAIFWLGTYFHHVCIKLDIIDNVNILLNTNLTLFYNLCDIISLRSCLQRLFRYKMTHNRHKAIFHGFNVRRISIKLKGNKWDTTILVFFFQRKSKCIHMHIIRHTEYQSSFIELACLLKFWNLMVRKSKV